MLRPRRYREQGVTLFGRFVNLTPNRKSANRLELSLSTVSSNSRCGDWTCRPPPPRRGDHPTRPTARGFASAFFELVDRLTNATRAPTAWSYLSRSRRWRCARYALRRHLRHASPSRRERQDDWPGERTRFCCSIVPDGTPPVSSSCRRTSLWSSCLPVLRLNPVESIWQHLRANWLSNRIFDTYDNIIDAACNAWSRLVAQPQTITSIATVGSCQSVMKAVGIRTLESERNKITTVVLDPRPVAYGFGNRADIGTAGPPDKPKAASKP